MELLDISEKHKMTREEAAKLLHEIADSLARNNELAFEQRGIKITIDVPKQVEVEVEVELKPDESSLEIEISW